MSLVLLKLPQWSHIQCFLFHRRLKIQITKQSTPNIEYKNQIIMVRLKCSELFSIFLDYCENEPQCLFLISLKIFGGTLKKCSNFCTINWSENPFLLTNGGSSLFLYKVVLVKVPQTRIFFVKKMFQFLKADKA